MRRQSNLIFLLFFLLFSDFLSITSAQEDVQQLNLPEDAVRRLGRGSINEIVYAPDGKSLAVAGSAGVWIYEADTLNPLKHLTEHGNWVHWVYWVSFSPDSRTIASVDYDGTVRLWDINTGRNINTFSVRADKLIDSVGFSPDGETIAIGSGQYTVGLWNMNTGRKIKTLKATTDLIFDFFFGSRLFQDTGRVRGISFSPDGRTIATGHWDKDIARLWDVRTGRQIKKLTGHTELCAVSFSPDGHTLVTGSDDGTIYLWDVKTGRQIKRLTAHADTGKITGAEFEFVHSRVPPHPDAVQSVCFSPDGRTIASGSYGGTVRLWDVNTGRSIKTLIRHAGLIADVRFSPDGHTLITWSGDGTIYFWDVKTGKNIKTLTAHTYWIGSTRFSPDGNTIATVGNWNGTIHLWDANTGRNINTLMGHTREVMSVCFSSDGRTIASGSDDKTVRLWDIKTGENIKTLAGHRYGVNSVSFSPDGQTLTTGCRNDTVRLWDVKTGENIKTLDREQKVSVSVSPDGQTLALQAGIIIGLWDVNTDGDMYLFNDRNIKIDGNIKTLIRTGHTSWIVNVSFSPDGHTIASWDGDGTILLWDIKTGRNIKTLKGHKRSVNSVSFSPDGETIATTSQDRTVLLWDVSTPETER